jgi:hypothetical protein
LDSFNHGRYPVPNKDIMQNVQAKTTDKIDTSLLGILDRDEFDFKLYAEILEHFKLEAYDWENPGRSSDARLVEIVETEKAKIRQENTMDVE